MAGPDEQAQNEAREAEERRQAEEAKKKTQPIVKPEVKNTDNFLDNNPADKKSNRQ